MRNFQYQVKEQVFDSKSMLDELNFYHQNHGKVSELTNKLTYILGDYASKYPISMMTMGNLASSNASKEIEDVQFTYPVMGRTDKASSISSNLYSASDQPGIGNSLFKLRFNDNWIKRYYIIESARGIQAYVTDDPIQLGDEWEYTVQLDPAEATDFCPFSETSAGTLWVELNVQVAESESRGTRSKMVSSGLYKNQMGFIRSSFEWAGNAVNKTMSISVKNPQTGNESTAWMDFAMWQFENRYLDECEHAYWYSRYNRLASGEVPLKDLTTGKIIPRGSGLLEQIQNKSTFASQSYVSLQNKIGDALFGQSDTEGMSITLQGGTGARRDLDRMLKAQGVTFLTDFTGVADKFVSGSNRDLMLGGFFTGFYHIDGYTIKFKYNPIFDKGKIASKSPLHPESGLPLESHRMVFIDDNDYDGQPNITHVSQKGRSFRHGIVGGLSEAPKSIQIMNNGVSMESQVAVMANEIDKSAYHRFKSAGIQMLRANKCFDLQCIAGL
jgi:hypothetical protein